MLAIVLSALSIGVALIGASGQWHANSVLRSMYQDRMVAMQSLTSTLGHLLRLRGTLLRASRLAPGAEREAMIDLAIGRGVALQQSWSAYMATDMSGEERQLAARVNEERLSTERKRMVMIEALRGKDDWNRFERDWFLANERFGNSVEHLVSFQRNSARAAYERDLERTGNITRLLLAMVGLSLLVGVGLSWAIVRSITVPMRAAVQAARRIADGDLYAVLPADGSDETGEMLLEIKRMKQALRGMATANRAKLDGMVAMTEAVPVAMFQLHAYRDGSVRFDFVGSRVRDLLGIEAAQLMADPRAGWRHVEPDVAGRVRATFNWLVNDLGAVIDEKVCVHAGTEHRWVRMRACATSSQGEEFVVWNGFFEDVTEQLASERTLLHAKEAAEAAARVKSEFLANMSHEIRTPMHAILGMSHLALQTELNLRQRDYIGKIQRAGKHLLGIINDILDFSKIEAGKMSTEHVDFNLDTMLDNVASFTAERAAVCRLELLFDIAPDVPLQLRGDPLRLGQVLTNFLGNAIKFTDEGEVKVAVSVVEHGDKAACLHFAVSDTGLGLSEDECGRLFQSFQQADTSTTRKYGGTGLGLTISKRLVEMMGGTLGVKSKPGQGSTFWFTVPLGVTAARAPLRLPELAGCRALVVDDNASARGLLAGLLDRMGLQASQAASGDEALAAIVAADAAGQHVRFMLVDLDMAEMRGWQMLNELAGLTLSAMPDVVPVATLAGEDLHRQAGVFGLPGVLLKPIMHSHLAEILLSAVREHPNDAAAAGKVVADDELQRLAGARVLLVEDNEVNQQVACELLTGAGLLVDTAADGQAALAKLAAGRYDLVLMDMQMPVMNGLDATIAIRQGGETQLPIIAMTANVMAEDRLRCREAGMNDFLGKPLEPEVLSAMLLRWIAPRAGGPRRPAAPAHEAGQDAAPPPIRGVDSAAGLRRVRGNAASYRRMLSTFLRDQRDVGARLRAARAEGDDQRVVALLHTLRGVAGNIGAQGLPATALRLERALQAGERAGLTELWTRFDIELADLLDAVAQALPPEAPAAAAAVVAVDASVLEQACRRLDMLLAENDAAAEKLFKEQEGLLAAAFGPACGQIALALENFEFEEALTVLRQARQRYAATTSAQHI